MSLKTNQVCPSMHNQHPQKQDCAALGPRLLNFAAHHSAAQRSAAVSAAFVSVSSRSLPVLKVVLVRADKTDLAFLNTSLQLILTLTTV